MAKNNKKKDFVPREHYEMTYQMNPKKNTKSVMGAVFEPMRAKKRMKTYNKVNSTDH